MVKDYHFHPQIIQHSDKFKEFAEVAIQNGVEEVCITDHMPLIGNIQADRIPHGKVAEYCRRAREIADKYKGRLSVKCGIEIDYHPSHRDQIEAVLKAGQFDYVLGSSHLHVMDGLHTAKTHNDYAKAMFENTISAAKSGYFSAIAHLDMHRWIFTVPNRFPLIDDKYSEEKHKELIEETLEVIKDNGLRIEINPHFASTSQNTDNIYPNIPIVKMALDKGISFSYGSDAHTCEDVGCLLNFLRNHEIYGKAIKNWEEEK